MNLNHTNDAEAKICPNTNSLCIYWRSAALPQFDKSIDEHNVKDVNIRIGRKT